jgi:hypothetical protein
MGTERSPRRVDVHMHLPTRTIIKALLAALIVRKRSDSPDA